MKDFELSQSEQDERLAAAATSYGVGTRSYNRSPEKAELDRQKKSTTEKYLASPRREVEIGPRCACRSFRLPHDLSAHRSLRDDKDWTPWEDRYYFDRQNNCYALKVQRYQEPIR